VNTVLASRHTQAATSSHKDVEKEDEALGMARTRLLTDTITPITAPQQAIYKAEEITMSVRMRHRRCCRRAARDPPARFARARVA